VKQKLLRIIYNLNGFKPFHLLNRRKILILMYHRFSETQTPYRISAVEFEEHLKYLSKHNTVVSMEDAANALANGKKLPPNPTVITIDDGYSDAYDIAFPILKKHEMPATLFTISDFVEGKIWLWTDIMRYVFLETKRNKITFEFGEAEKFSEHLGDKPQRFGIADRINSCLKQLSDYEKELRIQEIAAFMDVEIPLVPTKDFAAVTWAQASEMDKSSVKIEAHTVSHPILPNVQKERVETELKQGKDAIEKKLSREIKHFCYPNGAISEEVVEVVQASGYETAVTTEYGFNHQQTNPFLLKRIDASASIENFAQSVSGFESFRLKIKI